MIAFDRQRVFQSHLYCQITVATLSRFADLYIDDFENALIDASGNNEILRKQN